MLFSQCDHQDNPAQLARPFRQSTAFRSSKIILALPVYSRVRLNAINLAWLADIEKTGGKIPAGLVIEQNDAGTPTAIQVAALAMTKRVTEANILRSIIAAPEVLGTVTDEAAWNKIAQLHMADAQLDARSIGLIQRQTQKALSADGGASPDKTLKTLVEKLQRNIALDTVRNEYLLHTKLYGWLITDPSHDDVKELNKKVYAELFLTPASDPWLGLFSPEVYTALEGGGVSR